MYLCNTATETAHSLHFSPCIQPLFMHFPHHDNCIAALSPPNDIKCLVIKLTNTEPVGCRLNCLDLEMCGNGSYLDRLQGSISILSAAPWDFKERKKSSLWMYKSRVVTVSHEICTKLKACTHHPMLGAQMSISFVQVHKLWLAILHDSPDLLLTQNCTTLLRQNDVFQHKQPSTSMNLMCTWEVEKRCENWKLDRWSELQGCASQ